MNRHWLLGFALLCLRQPGSAQAPAPTAWIAGSWRLDPARSDSLPRNPVALAACAGAGQGGPIGLVPRDAVVTISSSGPTTQVPREVVVASGAGGTNVLVPRDVVRASVASGDLKRDGWTSAPRPVSDPRVAALIEEVHVPSRLLVALAGVSVSVTSDTAAAVVWQSDGRRRVEAQFEGGVLDRLARWKGELLVLERGYPACSATVRREFKRVDDGNGLQLKEVIERPYQKLERKFYFSREGTATVSP